MDTLLNYISSSVEYLKDLKTLPREFKRDKVLQNSLYLMSSTAVMALFGFVFWLVSARLYSATQLGISSTLISSATTLSLFSLLGFDNVLVRYLPASRRPDRVIDTSLLFTSLASIVLSVAFLAALPVISPSLHATLAGPWKSAFFVLTLLLVTINTLTDSVFIGWAATKYILLADVGLSIAKVGLPIMLVAFGAYGIFTGYAVAVTVATVISLVVLARRYKYYFKPLIHRKTIAEVRSFSTGTYLANLAAAAPLMVMPIMATNLLGAKSAAYFNLAMTIAAILFIIPRSTANTLFAESSKRGKKDGGQYARTIRQTALLLGPAAVMIFLFGNLLLLVFGKEYAAGSTVALRILALSSIPVAATAIATITLKVNHRLKTLVAIETAGTFLMLVVAWPLMKMFGVNGAAWAWLSGQTLLAILLVTATLPIIRSAKRKDAASEVATIKGAGATV